MSKKSCPCPPERLGGKPWAKVQGVLFRKSLYLAAYVGFFLFNPWRILFMPAAVLYEIMKVSLWTRREGGLTSFRGMLLPIFRMLQRMQTNILFCSLGRVYLQSLFFPPQSSILSSTVLKPVIPSSHCVFKSLCMTNCSKAGNSWMSLWILHLVLVGGTWIMTWELQVVDLSSGDLSCYHEICDKRLGGLCWFATAFFFW